MAPVLVVAYVRLAWREEREMQARFGEAYREYRRRVPGFIPALPLPAGETGPAKAKDQLRDGGIKWERER
ncbi:MAG: hypothetical protein A3K12_10815 [Candidatus Rokubacteria bacterium RIFCSPLOWO2_12_FULL_71_19]|nr:MAG: hypothetical protein A3K12_10815 [Candidatus Rokubacteria bacterium RIFCSPLOWO2_12_FULL_71_19]